MSKSRIWTEQGWIHSYPSRVRVGRGCIWGHLITWAGAVRPMTAKKQKKVKCDGQMDWRTDADGRTKRGVESCSTRLKMDEKSRQNNRKTYRQMDWGTNGWMEESTIICKKMWSWLENKPKWWSKVDIVKLLTSLEPKPVLTTNWKWQIDKWA